MPHPGEPTLATAFARRPGGKAFHQAVAAAHAGVATGLIAAIGDDLIDPEGIPFNVLARWQICQGAHTARAAVIQDGHGHELRTLAPGASDLLTPDFVQAQDDLFAQARVVLVSTQTHIDAVATALDMAASRRLLGMLDAGPLHAELTVRELSSTDVLLTDVYEFTALCARFLNIDIAATAVTGMDDTTINALARRLCAGTVVVSLNAGACLVSHGVDLRGDDLPCYRVQACALGDTFKGTLAARLVEPGPFRHALMAACGG
nr:PfkB family carbohydrate kinase [Luteibacter sp. Sphag1AF]